MNTKHMDIHTVAGLARIALSPEEAAIFNDQLDRVLEHIAQLERVNVEGVEPTAHANPVFNITREDEPVPGLDREAALGLAPQQAHHLILVPKVIE